MYDCSLYAHTCLVALKQTLFSGFVQFGAGLSVGLSCLAAGIAIGITGDAGVRATAQQPRMFVGMVSLVCFVTGRLTHRDMSVHVDLDSHFR